MASTPSILIVEDEYGLAELLRDMLIELGYEVSLAINGRLALDVLREREIHLVLTDAMMPVMDGPELARAMRADERHRRIPIVMMTSLRAAVPQTPGLYEAVLGKPFTPAALMKVLDDCEPLKAAWRGRSRGPER
jgi:CheY-like chemotaxis protein